MMETKFLIRIKVNGKWETLNVLGSDLLVDVLRDRLGLTGTKKGCGKGDCGVCTILMDNLPVNSCLVLAVQADGREVLTIDGIGEKTLHPIQKAFVEKGAVQCGYCTPGMVLSAKALLEGNPMPSDDEIRRAISGNLCRCTGYMQIVEAIKSLKTEKG
jgi:carbon-monoxide dehydrogenase small subunit